MSDQISPEQERRREAVNEMVEKMMVAGWVKRHAYDPKTFSIEFTEVGTERLVQLKSIIGEVHDAPLASFDFVSLLALLAFAEQEGQL